MTSSLIFPGSASLEASSRLLFVKSGTLISRLCLVILSRSTLVPDMSAMTSIIPARMFAVMRLNKKSLIFIFLHQLNNCAPLNMSLKRPSPMSTMPMTIMIAPGDAVYPDYCPESESFPEVTEQPGRHEPVECGSEAHGTG